MADLQHHLSPAHHAPMDPNFGDGEECPLRLDLTSSRLTSGTIMRAMSPIGIYWSDSLFLPTALYVNVGDLIFTACHFDEDHQPEDFYTDFDDPRVEECRLYAALMLPLDLDEGLVLPFPTVRCLEVGERLNLADATVLLELDAFLRKDLAQSSQTHRALLPPLPPCAGGPAYDLRSDKAPLDLQRRIHEAIDVSDHLMMRGLGAYVRSEMLMHRSSFIPEAFYSLFVSLDATFSLVLRRLRVAGVSAPNAYDAQTFIEEAFGEEPSSMRYFQEFYDDRVAAFHPESRFGTYPYPRLSVSEGYQLSKALRAVWRFLIVGDTRASRSEPSRE